MDTTFYTQKGNEKYTDSCGLETSMSGRYALAQLVVALRYKQDGRGFDSR
jgi:hypothetical protein